jgi:hypothetical protein
LVAAAFVLLALVGTGRAGASQSSSPQTRDERRAVIAAQEAALQARRDSLHALDPQHPAIAATHTAAALEGWTQWVESARREPSDAFIFEPPIDHEVLAVGVEEIDGAQVAFVTDCQLWQGEKRVGYSFEPEPSDDPADRNTMVGADILTKVDGAWKLGLFMQVSPGERGTLGCMSD